MSSASTACSRRGQAPSSSRWNGPTGGFRREASPLAKYHYLRALQDRNEVLYYALLERHLPEMLPIVYTPTVGEAIQSFSFFYRSPRGLSLSPANVERADRALGNVPMDDVHMIVATDSSAILGIGDQGYGGLAIAIGKLALYTVAGGVAPYTCLPVGLDVGTDRADLREDPFYLGARQTRLRGDGYFIFLDAFVRAVKTRYPHAVIQWEDFAKDTAFAVLERYRNEVPSFNDDIQGTGAVALAGVLGACRLRGERLRDQRIVVHGAGAGGAGVASALVEGLVRDGLGRPEAHGCVYVLDSKGLLTESRASSMEDYKRRFAQPDAKVRGWSRNGKEAPSLVETIENAKATVLLGLSGQGHAFGEPVLKAMRASTDRPVVFPLSNPTSASEALPEEVFAHCGDGAIVATGSPFPAVVRGGKTFVIGQGNNAFVFPGLGFGAILAGAREVTDGMVLAGAYALADYTKEKHPDSVYPPVADLREVSVRVAARVLGQARKDGVARHPWPEGSEMEHVRARAWNARYLPKHRKGQSV